MLSSRRSGVFAILVFACVVAVPDTMRAAEKAAGAISAQTVTDAVEDEFLFDSAVPTTIDVKTDDGVVTLSGTVGNMLAKQRAERLAMLVKGVRAVVNRIEVRPSIQIAGTSLKNDVTRALALDAATANSRVAVRVDDTGTVTLSGTVDSWVQRDLVEKTVSGVRGVRAIDNKVTFENKSDRPDSQIKAEILGLMRWNALLDHELIDVDVRDGIVRLTGIVGSTAERTYAHYDAWVPGAKEVDFSGLEIKNWARDPALRKTKYVVKSDDALAAGLGAALRQDPRIQAYKIRVDAVGGIITMRGIVGNLAAKRAAERNAHNTVGVRGVINRIRVRPSTAQKDNDVANRVRAAFKLDPYIERHKVSVTVSDGVAHLYGFVDLSFEKARAEEIAARVDGIVDVENYIDIRNMRRPLSANPYAGDPPSEWYEWYEYQAPGTSRRSADIKSAIERRLAQSPFLDSSNITVTVKDRTALLSGTVESAVEHRLAVELAYRAGAASVVNDLTLLSKNPR